MARAWCGKVTTATSFPPSRSPSRPRKPSPSPRDSSRWANTSAIPEVNEDGYPSLRYALIYIESQDQLETLEAYQIDWDFLPMFREERAKWSGQKGIFEFIGDGRGVFVYAFLPAAVYNAIRAHSLDFPDEQPYRVVVLRDFPASVATYADGSIDYEVLGAEGYLYRGIAAPEAGDAAVGRTSQALIGRIVRGVVKGIKAVADVVVDGVRKGVGEVSQLVRGEAALNLTFWPLNTDSGFEKRPMQRAWGPGRGVAIPLSGMPVRVNQGRIGFKLHTGSTNEYGYARVIVARDQPTSLCFDLVNGAAEITAFLGARRICNFDGDELGRGDVNGEVTRHFMINSGHVNGFAQFTDGARYMKEVSGYTMRRARVLTGSIANFIGDNSPGANAITPCMNIPNWAFDPLFDSFSFLLVGIAAGTGVVLDGILPGLGAIVANVGAGAAFAPGFLSPDILMHKDPLRSRGVPTHEYGHFVMCALMYDEGAYDFGSAYTGVIMASLASEKERAEDDQSYVAEAWADFFSAQVAGGVNYYVPFGETAAGRLPATSAHMAYCDPREPSCMDNNVGGPKRSLPLAPYGVLGVNGTAFEFKIEKVVTTLHDVFDGNPATGSSFVPTNGAAWFNDKPINGDRTLSTAPYFWNTSSFQPDEAIALPLDLRDLIREWAAVDFNSKRKLKEKNFGVALSAYMTKRGVSDEAICELFALHESTQTCPSYLPVTKNLTPGPATLRGYLFSTNPSVEDPQGRNGRWEWSSDAPYATAFVYEIRNLQTRAVLATGNEAFGQRGRTVAVERRGLPFNTEIGLSVTVENGARRSPKVTAIVATPAQPVVEVYRGLIEPGKTEICWRETEASSYLLERSVAGGAFEDVVTYADGPDGFRCHMLWWLEDVPHSFRVTAQNQHGTPTTPSAALVVTPIAPVEVFVSASWGDDVQPWAGEAGTPFRTLGAALAFVRQQRGVTVDVPVCGPSGCSTVPSRSRAYDAARINLAEGQYALDTALRIDGAAFATELLGGLSDDGAWQQPPGARSTLSLPQGAGLPPEGGEGGRNACTGAGVQAGAAVLDGGLRLARLNLRVAATSQGNLRGCQAAVAASGVGALQVFDSEVSLAGGGTGLANSCQFGVSASSRLLELQESRVVAAAAPNDIDLVGSYIAVCAAGGTASIADSTLTITDGRPRRGAGSVAGVLASVEDLRVERSRVTIAERDPGWESPMTQLGIVASAPSTLVHNSIIRTATGGIRNHALWLDGRGDGPITGVYFVTALTGADWSYRRPGPSDAEGAAVLLLSGNTQRLDLVNSLIGYGAGEHPRIAGIDRSGIEADPHGAFIAGNIVSAYNPEGNAVAAESMRCSTGRYAINQLPTDMNDPLRHVCVGVEDLTMISAADNTFLSSEGCTTLDCLNRLSGRSSAYDGRRLAFLDAGQAVPLPHGAVACRGVSLLQHPRWPKVNRDIDGRLRPDRMPGVDDDCDGVIDEPGEQRTHNSVGAFHEDCFCEAWDLTVY